MNRQLLDNGILWVRVLYIDNADTGSYLVELQLDPNTTHGERTVAFGTYASHVYIKDVYKRQIVGSVETGTSNFAPSRS